MDQNMDSDNQALTGLLIGAGASSELGMPMVVQLTAELRKLLTPEKLRELNHNWRSQGGGYPDDVVDNLAEVLVTPEMHYEGILGYLEKEYLRRGGHGDGQHYHALFQRLVDAIYLLLYSRHLRYAGQLDKELSEYSGIQRLAAQNKPLWVFSLNYDLMMECIAAHFKIPLNAGFSEVTELFPQRDTKGVKTGDLVAKVITAEQLEKTGLFFSLRGTHGINLLKIHGSLDVFSYDDAKKFIKFSPLDASVDGVLGMLRSVNQDLRYAHPDLGVIPQIATGHIVFLDNSNDFEKPMLLRKTLMAGAFKFTPRYPQVLPKRFLDYFQSYILNVKTLIAIGYGFNDTHVNEVVRGWLEFLPERILMIVDPHRKQIPSSFIHLARQIQLVPSTAARFLSKYPSVQER